MISPSLRWTLLILLSLGMVIAYVDRINLSVVLAIPDFARRFSLSDSDRGMLNSAFFWSYALAQIPAGWCSRPLWFEVSVCLGILVLEPGFGIHGDDGVNCAAFSRCGSFWVYASPW